MKSKPNGSATDKLEIQGLPAAPEIENLVLGTLIRSGCFETVQHSLDETSFTTEPGRIVWGAMREMLEAGVEIRTASLAQWLQDRNRLDPAGRIGYIVDLEAEGIPGITLDSYVGILQEKQNLRSTIVALNHAMLSCMEPGSNSTEVVARAQELLSQVERDMPGRSTLKTPREIIDEVGYSEFVTPSRLFQNAVPLPETWRKFREIVPTFRSGQLIVLAGHTSQGKTAMASQIAINAARNGLQTAIFSMEMDNLENLQRAASHMADVDSYAHQGSRMNFEERRRFDAATADLYENKIPLFLDDSTGNTVPAIAAQIAKAKPRPRFVIIDYLQLMESAGKAENRAQAVSEVSRGLKRLAQQFQIPVLALSQFNRESSKAGRKPELHDLRESGSIEQDANIVMMIVGKAEQENLPMMNVELMVRKNRGGRRGSVQMLFQKPVGRFEEI